MTHWRCSGVSGMEHPRADSTAQNALLASHPSRTKTDTTSTEERPMLARQCTPRDRPALTISARCSTERKKPSLSDGTERSGIGRFMNLIAAASHSPDSRWSPRSLVSSSVSMETRTSIPSRESALSSSQSQSPPRGRATIAMRLGAASLMEYMVAFICSSQSDSVANYFFCWSPAESGLVGKLAPSAKVTSCNSIRIRASPSHQ
jgi:hypothetical protein